MSGTEREVSIVVFVLAQRGCWGGMSQRFIMIKTGTLRHTNKQTNYAKWLVPPFYVRNLSTEGGRINYQGYGRKKKS